MGGRGTIFVNKDAWTSATTRLILVCALYSMGSVFFGYDGASFGGVQAFTPFAKQFGSQDTEKNKWALSAKTASLMNSLALLGKLLGTLICGPLIERFGHRTSMIITCSVQIVGVVVQTTSRHVPQFTVGRIIVYTAVGLVENVVPTYQAEISPAPLRGFFVGSIQLFLTFGSLIAGIVNEAMSRYTSDFGWIFATAIQALPAIIILVGLPFTPHSPRWLVSKDRLEDAGQVLRLLRTQADVDNGVCELELAAMCSDTSVRQHKDSWMSLLRGTNLRRTMIACTIMALQQLTGVTFSSSYGPTFYKQVGLGDMAFAYAAINNGVSVVTAIISMIILDSFGRRSVTFWGCIVQGLFLFLIGGLGSQANRSTGSTNGMVASFILYAAVLHMSLGPAAYVTASEVGTSSLREKTMAVSTAVNVVIGFAVVFSTPYLLNSAYVGLGPKLGYVWGAFSVAGAVWVWLCMPELKGRNLEEIDELFSTKLAAWRFNGYKTSGLSHDIGALQQNHGSALELKSAALQVEHLEVGEREKQT